MSMQRNKRNTQGLVSRQSYPHLPVYSSEFHAMPCHIHFFGFALLSVPTHAYKLLLCTGSENSAFQKEAEGMVRVFT